MFQPFPAHQCPLGVAWRRRFIRFPAEPLRWARGDSLHGPGRSIPVPGGMGTLCSCYPPELVRPGRDPEPDDWPNTTKTGRRERVSQGGWVTLISRDRAKQERGRSGADDALVPSGNGLDPRQPLKRLGGLRRAGHRPRVIFGLALGGRSLQERWPAPSPNASPRFSITVDNVSHIQALDLKEGN